jgi:hypothetical protein
MKSKSTKRFTDLRIYEIGKWTLGYAQSHLFQLSLFNKINGIGKRQSNAAL